MSVLLVGELNPYTADHQRFALWDEPAGAAGDRLRRILGLRVETYRAQCRTNLCVNRWSAAEARRRAALMIVDRYSAPYDVVVMLGRKVAVAFGAGALPAFGARPTFAGGSFGEFTLVALPHPSGRCRAWNEPGAVERARALLREVAPRVPWGEEP